MNAGQMGRGRRPQPGQAGAGQRRFRSTGIARAARPLDQPVVHQAVDESGDAALGQEERVGEASHPEAVIRRLGQVEEGLVLLQGQRMTTAQVLVELARQSSMGMQERPPRTKVQGMGRSRWRPDSHGHIVPDGGCMANKTKTSGPRGEVRPLHVMVERVGWLDLDRRAS